MMASENHLFVFSLFHESRPPHHGQPDNNRLQWGRIGNNWGVSVDVGFVDHSRSAVLGSFGKNRSPRLGATSDRSAV